MATLCPSGGGGSQLLVGSSPRHCGPGSCHPAPDSLLTHPGPRGQLSETRLVIWGNVWTAIVWVCVQKTSLCVKHWLDGAWASSWLVASPSSASAYRPHPAYRPNQIDLNLLVGPSSSILVCLVSKPRSQDGLVGAALVNWALPVVEARLEKCAGSSCILDISCFFFKIRLGLVITFVVRLSSQLASC